MIGYCPLDEDYERVPMPPVPRFQPPQDPGLLEGEDTECNYLVLFFILGVMILAASDSLRK
jgi:hypothetical protein